MAFVSYAQNFEDVMLYRALKEVKNGFYIDVGANDPKIMSVTKSFYDMGWHGINIEPMQQYYDEIVTQRTRDINLQCAASNEMGETVLYEIADTGLSTLDKKVAELEKNRGFNVIEKKIVIETLNHICEEYAVKKEIHFLKIDVEGFETQVIEGMNFKEYRPWIIVVEATKPLSDEVVYFSGEKILCDNGYEEVYFDGLNKFYLAQEKEELKSRFFSPPNVFDEFVSIVVVERDAIIDDLNKKINSLNMDVNNVRSINEKQREELILIQNELSEIKSSKMYKIKMLVDRLRK